MRRVTDLYGFSPLLDVSAPRLAASAMPSVIVLSEVHFLKELVPVSGLYGVTQRRDRRMKAAQRESRCQPETVAEAIPC